MSEREHAHKKMIRKEKTCKQQGAYLQLCDIQSKGNLVGRKILRVAPFNIGRSKFKETCMFGLNAQQYKRPARKVE